MTSRLRGLLLLILVTAVWGSTFAVVKQLGEVLPPAVLIAWRFLIAALALLPAALLLRPARPAVAPASPLWRDGLLLGAWLIAGYGTQTVALQTT
ncbi:EamA family transporter, partial [uncultured Deinococcus sp.]